MARPAGGSAPRRWLLFAALGVLLIAGVAASSVLIVAANQRWSGPGIFSVTGTGLETMGDGPSMLDRGNLVLVGAGLALLGFGICAVLCRRMVFLVPAGLVLLGGLLAFSGAQNGAHELSYYEHHHSAWLEATFHFSWLVIALGIALVLWRVATARILLVRRGTRE